MPKTHYKKEFCTGFNGNHKNLWWFLLFFFCFVFFQQGKDTHTALHTIDNIELKLDFAKLKSNQIAIAISVKIKKQLDIF